MFLIFLQPDLGSTLVFPPIAFSILYASAHTYPFFRNHFPRVRGHGWVFCYGVFRYYQYKLENPRSSEAIEAYEDTSLLPLKDYPRKRILTFLAPEVEDPKVSEQTGIASKL